LIAKKVRQAILSEIAKSKYFAISVDSTPDLAHIDQLTFTVRYVNNGEPVERFLDFIPIFGHGSEYLATVVLKNLEHYGM